MSFLTPIRMAGHIRVLLLPLFVLSASCAPASAQPDPRPSPLAQASPADPGTIQVTGQAQIPVPADQVRISFAVETEGPTAGEATRLNAGQMDAVIGALRAEGIQGLEIETFGYSLRAEYEAPRDDRGNRSISGYRAINNIRVVNSDLDATGRILDAAVEAGANRISGLQFEASDTREARLRALREAVTQAREQAETIADAMGVRLGAALEVSGGANVPSPRNDGALLFRSVAAEATTPVEAGSLTVTASVNITYRILEGIR